jgi:predicted Zn-dependent protease
MPPTEPMSAVLEKLEKVLSYSVADETELLWIETRRGEVASGRRRDPGAKESPLLTRRAVTVRVKEGPRLGRYTTEDGEPAELASAVRVALAHAHVTHAEAGPWQPPGLETTPTAAGYFDPEIATLQPTQAAVFNEIGLEKGETSRLTWSTLRVAFLSSRGVRHTTELTGAAVLATSGKGVGTGQAEHAARTVAGLNRNQLLESARAQRWDGPVAEDWNLGTTTSLLLAPPVVATLVALLNSVALTAEAFNSRTPLAPKDLGSQPLSPHFSLWDDGSDADGLAFPFDFEGRVRRRVELFERGVFRSAAIDSALAAEVGLPITPHYLGPSEVRAQHLCISPGETTSADLLVAAEDGLWMGWLSSLSPLAPGSSHFQATVEGCRRIRGGRLTEALPPLRWDDDLLQVFARLTAVGDSPRTRALDSDLRGGIRAPALLAAAGGSFSR